MDNDSDSMSSGEASLLLSVGIISSQGSEQDTTMNVVQPVQEEYESENEVRFQSQMSQCSSLTMSSSPISPNEGTSDSDESEKTSEQQIDAATASVSGTSTETAKKAEEVVASDDDETPKNDESTSIADGINELMANRTVRNVQDADSSSNTSEEDNAVVSNKSQPSEKSTVGDAKQPSKALDSTVSINLEDSDDDCCVVESGSNQPPSGATKPNASIELPATSKSEAAAQSSASEPLARPPGLTGTFINQSICVFSHH